MHSLDPIPSVRRLSTDRDDAYAFEITGFVTSADAENLYGLLEGAYALHDRIDLLVRFVDVEGIDWAEVSDETKRLCRERADRHINRCAAVGTAGFATGLLEEMLCPSLRHFEPASEADAWAYVEAAETGS